MVKELRKLDAPLLTWNRIYGPGRIG